MSGAVDWDVARTVASKVAGREPYTAARYRDGLEEDFGLDGQGAGVGVLLAVDHEHGLVHLIGEERR